MATSLGATEDAYFGYEHRLEVALTKPTQAQIGAEAKQVAAEDIRSSHCDESDPSVRPDCSSAALTAAAKVRESQSFETIRSHDEGDTDSNTVLDCDSHYDEMKYWEAAFMGVKDRYAELAKAAGSPTDCWFGDPLEGHDIVLQRIKTLAAAAEVGEKKHWVWLEDGLDPATIERCAQVVQDAMNKGNIGWQDGMDIIAAIRKLKDETTT